MTENNFSLINKFFNNHKTKQPTFATEMKTKNIHNSLSPRQNNDRLAGYLPAKGSGCGMYFIELKCKL